MHESSKHRNNSLLTKYFGMIQISLTEAEIESKSQAEVNKLKDTGLFKNPCMYSPPVAEW